MASHAKKDRRHDDRTREEFPASEAPKEVAPGEEAEHAKKVVSKRHTGVLVAVIVFSVVMVSSMLLPSLSAIFGGGSTTASTTTAAATTGDAETEAATTSPYNDNIAKVDDTYASKVAGLEGSLEGDADNLATLINLGNDCFAWGYQVHSYAATDAETTHANELLNKAIGYYDRYLELNDAKEPQVNRALCQYYLGRGAEAVAALEDFTSRVADFAPAWANLGMMYQSAGETDAAKDAYTKALGSDPDDKYGLKSSVQKQLDGINEDETAATTEAATTSASLADALQGASSGN